MTEFIDYLIRKELTLQGPTALFRTKPSNSHLKLIRQPLSSRKHLKLINLKGAQISSSQITKALQNNQIAQIEQQIQNSEKDIKSKKFNSKSEKSFSNHKDKYLFHFSPESYSFADGAQFVQLSTIQSLKTTEKLTINKISFKNIGNLHLNLKNLRKISPFQRDLKNNHQKNSKQKKHHSKQLTYTIETIYSLPTKKQNSHRKSQQNTPEKYYNTKASTEDKKEYLNQIESELHSQTYLYMAIQSNDVKFSVRCYFTDQNHQHIRIKDQYIRNQIIYQHLGQSHASNPKDMYQPSFALGSIKMRPQVNPLTGEVYLQFTFLSISRQIKLTELLDDCQTYLSGKSDQIYQLIARIQRFDYFEHSSLDSQHKKQGILDECKILLKANLFQSELWINNNITRWKEIQKKLQNQILMAYTFPNKVPQYEIMEDPFLRDHEKTYAINTLREKQTKKLQIQRQKQRQRQGHVQFPMINARNPEVSRCLSGLFLTIKKNLQQVNAEIERCRQNNDAKERNLMLRVESENRKRCHSLIVPANSNKIKDESAERLNIETNFNRQSIAQEIKKLKTNNLSPQSHDHQNYETILKLRTAGQQKFYCLKLITIPQLQIQMQVEKILSKCVSSRSNSHKPLSLGFYLFDYKNLQAYSKWLVEEKMQKSQLINGFLSSEFSFPSKQFFISSKEFSNAYNTQLSSDFIHNIPTLANPNSMPNIDNLKNAIIKSNQGSSDKIVENEDESIDELPKNLSYNKSYPSDMPSFAFLDWDKKHSKNVPKINTIQLPKNLTHEEKYIFSIRAASRVIRLGQFLQRNRTSLRFSKKVHIYKQIIQFYYILEYNGIDKQLRFGFENICICKNLNVKIDCQLNKADKDEKLPNMYSILLQIFLQIFLDGQYIESRKTHKFTTSHSGFQNSNQVTIQQEKTDPQPLQISENDQCTDSEYLMEENGSTTRNHEKTQGYEKFSQIRYLRHFGDVTFLKTLFTLLKRYSDIFPSENQQIFKGQPTSVWLFLLIRKLHDYLQL